MLTFGKISWSGIVRRDDNILEAPKATREIRKLENTCVIAEGHQIQLRESGERVEESAAMKPEDPDLAGVVEM